MKKSAFWLQVGLLVAGFATLNLLARVVLKSDVAHRTLARVHSYPSPSHIFIGNSLVEAGIKPQIVAAKRPGSRPLNIAIGGTQPPESYLLLSQVQNKVSDHPHVFYGFYDRQLTELEKGTWSDILGNRAILYLTNLNEATRLAAPDSPLLRAQMRLTAYSPLLIQRGGLWNKVEMLRRKVGEIGMPHQATNDFGRASDFTALEASDKQKFARDCQSDVTRKSPFNPSVQGIIEQTKKRGGDLTFVVMPMPLAHRKNFYSSPEWAMYQRHLQTLALARGVRFIDASAWISDKYFADALHLNHQGAEAFTDKLMTVTNASSGRSQTR